jgi:hypothetical protein
VLRPSGRIELTRRVWTARRESLNASAIKRTMDPRRWRCLERPKRQVCRRYRAWLLGCVPLNLSDRWALGQVLTILGRYRVNRMANGMDGIVGKGRGSSSREVPPELGARYCMHCGWMYCACTFNGSDRDGTFLAHTEYPALLSITAQLAGDEVGGDSPSHEAHERSAILPQ